MYSSEESSMPIGVKLVLGFLVLVFVIICLFSMFDSVGTGERGVVTHVGRVTGEIKGEGVYVVIPFYTEVISMNVQVQKEEAEASAASKDLQDVRTKVAVNYNLDPAKVDKLYQETQKDYKERLVVPAIQEVVKSATAQYTAEELITKRGDVKAVMTARLSEKLTPYGISIRDVNIVDFSFSQSFNAAIEAKVTAEQTALAEKNRLETIKYQAQQNIERAKGEAESIRIQSQALTEQPQFLEKMAIEKWDGKLPQTMIPGSAMPFIGAK